jgi:hypothetical protein
MLTQIRRKPARTSYADFDSEARERASCTAKHVDGYFQAMADRFTTGLLVELAHKPAALFTKPSSKVKLPKGKRGAARGADTHIVTFNLPALKTCPGASHFCVEGDADTPGCYADRDTFQYVNVQARYHANWAVVDAAPDAIVRAVAALPEATVIRIHVSGDFYSVAYVKAWRKALAARPDITLFGYTRSWRVAKLRGALERLRALPNVRLFASVDATTERAPDGWRVAFVEGTKGYEDAAHLPCPEQTYRATKGARGWIDCAACGFCFRGTRGNVEFSKH